MINKYYLYKKVFENKDCTCELKDSPAKISSEMAHDIFGTARATEDEIYKSRVDFIREYMERCIGNIPALTGKEARSLLDQYNTILKDLNDSWEGIKVILHTSTFKDMLELQLGVTLDRIYNYEKAERFLHGERYVHVNLDGNRTKCFDNGKEKRVMTKVVDNKITLEQCHRILKVIAEKYDCHPKQLYIDLSVYTETEDNEYGDFPEECLLNRYVCYEKNKDQMTMYENDKPVYNNCHGVICDDPVALADSIG